MADQFLQAPVIPDPQAGDILQAVATDAPAADFTATAEAITTADGLTSPATWQGSKTVKAEIVTEIVDKTGATAQLPPPDPAWEACLAQVKEHMRLMTTGECVYRATELQMLAQTELACRASPGTVIRLHPSSRMAAFEFDSSLKTSSRSRPAPAELTKEGLAKKRRMAVAQRPIAFPGTRPLPMLKMRPPIPPWQDSADDPPAELPPFSQLVNFPNVRHLGKCVMCGSDEFPVPKQNKGVCNNCDSAIWVLNPSGLLLKWCKGAKNFRKWSDFGTKGHSTKTVRYRDEQAQRYLRQKGIAAMTVELPVPGEDQIPDQQV